MTLCLDIHTHHPAPQPQAVIAASMSDFSPMDGQLYSLGVHPWNTQVPMSGSDWEEFERLASLSFVVAIGECGIDTLKGAPLYKQLLVFKRQIEISEKLGKPLIIHDVKAHDIIVGLKRDIKPRQKWMVHGFRGKPSVAKMLFSQGIYLSFGEKFNPETLPTVPSEMILAETDDSALSIEQIISNMSAVVGTDMTDQIQSNTMKFLFNEESIKQEIDINESNS